MEIRYSASSIVKNKKIQTVIFIFYQAIFIKSGGLIEQIDHKSVKK
jgi:hypothetical protein